MRKALVHSIGAVLLASVLGAPAGAQVNDGQGETSACGLGRPGAGTVARVLDARSFVLEDGREIRLAGIEAPLPARIGENDPHGGAATAARAALEGIVLGREIALRETKSEPDRYGRTIAYAAVKREGTFHPVQAALLAGGHARVGTEVETPACAAELLTRERLARNAKLGLWADPYYAVLGAESRGQLLAEQGHFSLVEGKVASVRESGGVIYVNFGRKWSQALTVTISKRNERMFTAAGVAVKALESRRVRVRGYIEERNGPRIEATRPEQIEIAELN